MNKITIYLNHIIDEKTLSKQLKNKTVSIRIGGKSFKAYLNKASTNTEVVFGLAVGRTSQEIEYMEEVRKDQ